MRLFTFKSFLSLDLYTYNLNIEKNMTTKAFIVFKNGVIVSWSHKIQKWQSTLLKLVKLNYFESIKLNQTISI